MSLAVTVVKPEHIRAFAARNGTTYASNRSPEVWAAFLAENGGTGTSLTALESTWLSGAGAVGNNLRDLWGNYLNQLGYPGNFKDQMLAFFSAGEPITIPAASPLDNLLIQDGFELLLETDDGLVLESVTVTGLLQEDGSSFVALETSLEDILLIDDGSLGEEG